MNSNFDNHYKTYLDNCLKLAGTVAVKSSYTAVKMNEHLILKKMDENIIDPLDPAKWPYYLNLCGEYHPAQELMFVTSMDTLETIAFTKDNLQEHNNTRREYSYGTHKYEELVARFPDQELLIKGILYPADPNSFWDLPEGSILALDNQYVEENEYTFVSQLDEWSKGYFARWDQPQYNINHNLFNIAFMGVYYTKLLGAIISIRLKMCLTNEAHSYHIRRFLASHDFMDFYMDMMTKEQSLKFYKNIRWIVRNLGHRFTFDYLVKLVMTKRHLPIADYTLVLDETPLENGEVRTNPRFDKHSINGLEAINQDLDSCTIEEMLAKEEPLALDNPNAMQESIDIAHEEYTASLSNEFRTKVLESKVIDYSNSEPVTLESVIADQWVDLVDRGMFRAVVLVPNPSNGETLPLPGMDALKLFNYALSKWQGVEPPCIPLFNVSMSHPKKRVTEADLKKLMPNPNYLKDSWFDYILKGYVPLKEIISIDAFYKQAYLHFQIINERIKLAGFEMDADARAFKEATVWRMYARRKVATTGLGETYADLLGKLGIEGHLLKQEEWGTLAKDIWKQISGASLTTTQSLRNVHKAMLQIMTKLTSYSIHYIGDINVSEIVPCRNIGIRIAGAPPTKGIFNLPMRTPDTRVLEARGFGYNKVILSQDQTNRIFEGNSAQVKSNVNSDYSGTDVLGTLLKIKGGKPLGVGVNGHLHGEVRDPSLEQQGQRMVPGLTGYLKLPLAIQRQLAKDTFGVDLEWMENRPNGNEPAEPLPWNVRNERLLGLNYSGISIPDTINSFINQLPPKDKYL